MDWLCLKGSAAAAQASKLEIEISWKTLAADRLSPEHVVGRAYVKGTRRCLLNQERPLLERERQVRIRFADAQSAAGGGH